MPTERERAQYNKESEIKYTDNPAPAAISNHLAKLHLFCPVCSIIKYIVLACFIIGLYIILI